jgi:hypothetical protein
MSREFEITIIVAGDEGASADAAEAAGKTMLNRARRFPPDMRFDWNDADVSAEIYTANPKGKK